MVKKNISGVCMKQVPGKLFQALFFSFLFFSFLFFSFGLFWEVTCMVAAVVGSTPSIIAMIWKGWLLSFFETKKDNRKSLRRKKEERKQNLKVLFA